jgi:hypothetical protein
LQQAIPNGCTAKTLPPSERLTLGLHALTGTETITKLADDFDVSRKFVYQQAATAQGALEEAFAPAAAADDRVLFHLPVTKGWLRQVTLGLVLICHSSFRGVHEFCRDLLGMNLSLGTVHNIVQDAVNQARAFNLEQDLAPVRIGAHDEIFQNRQPVLVGADVASTYCYLLSPEEQRDGDTWAIRLLELQDRGLAPDATIADFGTGLRAGQQQALPGVPCRGDVFHALQTVTALLTYLENRAYRTIEAHHKLAKKKAKIKRQGRATQGFATKVHSAYQAETQAVALADDIAVLTRWLHHDVLAVSGLPHADRCALYDFLVAELKAREHLCPHRIGPVCRFLENQRDDLLAFAAQLDRELAALAEEFQVPVAIVHELLDLQALDERLPQRWQREAALRQKLRDRFWDLSEGVQHVADSTVRASSVIGNLNSRLRCYFFLRRHLGPDYLALLQFFLNHRRFLRSEHPERIGKSPTELLTGQTHTHALAGNARLPTFLPELSRPLAELPRRSLARPLMVRTVTQKEALLNQAENSPASISFFVWRSPKSPSETACATSKRACGPCPPTSTMRASAARSHGARWPTPTRNAIGASTGTSPRS